MARRTIKLKPADMQLEAITGGFRLVFKGSLLSGKPDYSKAGATIEVNDWWAKIIHSKIAEHLEKRAQEAVKLSNIYNTKSNQ